MQLVQVAHQVVGAVVPAVVHLVDQVPEDKDVKAGWTAFAIFIGLAVAVAVLGVSLTRRLRNVETNRKAGVFGEVADDPAPLIPRGDDTADRS